MDRNKLNANELVVLNQLFKIGTHLGHKTSRWNSKMAPYLFGRRNDIHIINLEKTIYLLRRVIKIVSYTLKNNGNILIIGNSENNRKFVQFLGERFKVPYVCDKWVGGILGNWESFSKKMQSIKIKRRVVSFTKGLRFMNKKPDIIIILNINENQDAINEIRKLNIPIIGIVDTNSNLTSITYPVPGNDNSPVVQYFYITILENILTQVSKFKNKVIENEIWI
jgi:small subunit ribosomal protein S2